MLKVKRKMRRTAKVPQEFGSLEWVLFPLLRPASFSPG
jgi:hypothetical protein